MDIGILIMRIFFGLAIAAHGSQKLFGWFGGYGIKGTGQFFEGLGFRPGSMFAAAAGLGEFGGGVLLALGFFTPFGAASVLAAMLVAMVSVHLRMDSSRWAMGLNFRFFMQSLLSEWRLPDLERTPSINCLQLTRLFEPAIVAGVLVLAVIGAFVTLALRRQVHRQATAA